MKDTTDAKASISIAENQLMEDAAVTNIEEEAAAVISLE
jgi:hypothetical protein